MSGTEKILDRRAGASYYSGDVAYVPVRQEHLLEVLRYLRGVRSATGGLAKVLDAIEGRTGRAAQ